MIPVPANAVYIDGESVKKAIPFLEEQVVPTLERIERVASVNAADLIVNTVQLHLNQQRIDDLNQRFALAIDERFTVFNRELDKAQQQLIQKTAVAKQNLVGAQTALSVIQQKL